MNTAITALQGTQNELAEPGELEPRIRDFGEIGLNRKEGVHSLVRCLCVGQRGESRLRDLNAQVN